MKVTAAQLRLIMPRLQVVRSLRFAGHIRRAMIYAEITTPQRAAAFLAQVAHESGQLRYMAELWGPTEQQKRYDTAANLMAALGNLSGVGDGFKYRGRGLLQLTGRGGYARAGTALHLPLEARPELVEQPKIAALVAGWVWRDKGLNRYADDGPDAFDLITRRINGGLTGKLERDAFYRRALDVLTPRKGIA